MFHKSLDKGHTWNLYIRRCSVFFAYIMKLLWQLSVADLMQSNGSMRRRMVFQCANLLISDATIQVHLKAERPHSKFGTGRVLTFEIPAPNNHGAVATTGQPSQPIHNTSDFRESHGSPARDWWFKLLYLAPSLIIVRRQVKYSVWSSGYSRDCRNFRRRLTRFAPINRNDCNSGLQIDSIYLPLRNVEKHTIHTLRLQ